jgi:hypothetical protein
VQTKIKNHISIKLILLSVNTGHTRENIDTWEILGLQNLGGEENAVRSVIPTLPYIIMPQGPSQVTDTRHMSPQRSRFRCGRYILRDL